MTRDAIALYALPASVAALPKVVRDAMGHAVATEIVATLNRLAAVVVIAIVFVLSRMIRSHREHKKFMRNIQSRRTNAGPTSYSSSGGPGGASR